MEFMIPITLYWYWQTVHYSGVGEDFLARKPFFFLTKTADSRKRKVEKSIRECKIDRLLEGYKRATDKIRGPIAKHGFFGPNQNFWAQKKRSLFDRNRVPTTTRQSCTKKKISFSQMNISLLFCISNLSFFVFGISCVLFFKFQRDPDNRLSAAANKENFSLVRRSVGRLPDWHERTCK